MIYRIKISPESISSMVKVFNYDGNSVGVYTGMTNVLTGGTNGASTLTGLTIPILLTQDNIDMGYYSEFDGNIIQQDVATNFVFTGISETEYCVTNTSIFKTATENSTYDINWGDGSVDFQIKNAKQCHNYTKSDGEYVITLTQKNTFGTNIISKTITKPFKLVVAENPNGTFTFTPNFGVLKGQTIEYDYIFTGDTGLRKYYDNSTQNINVSGFTKSRLNDLVSYGGLLKTNIKIEKDNFTGFVTEIKSDYTAYTINDINYLDFRNGITSFNISNFNVKKTKPTPIVKNDVLMKSVSDIQIYSNVFIERGKNSGYEKIQRLGEIKTLQDMQNYGYGYFKLTNK